MLINTDKDKSMVDSNKLFDPVFECLRESMCEMAERERVCLFV